ncbi:hypothetical protein [Psychrobacter immobilis]|jgi:hypothetical protein|uniref:hypothetical protein n=1 Tax=Psychrobacter immobilis TaxID=498 RepID=UPI00191B8150|nr:hypothetical protein [Psychrobacter immobilis]
MQRFQLNTLSCSAVVMTLLFSGCAAKDAPVDKSLQEKEKVLTEAIEEKIEILEYNPPVYESSIDDGTHITDGTLLIKDNCLVVQHDIEFFGERSRESALVFPKNTTRFSDNTVLRQNSSYGVLLYQSSPFREYKIGEGYRFPGLASTIDDERIKPQPKCQLDNVWFVT